MLNEEKVKLMTSIAILEKEEAGNLALVKRYYKTDYIGKSMLCAFLGYTFCWIVGLALVIYCRIEDILSVVTLDDIVSPVVDCGVWYLLGLALYLAVACLMAYRRYRYAARGMKVYLARLKRLQKRYDFQDKAKEQGKEVHRP